MPEDLVYVGTVQEISNSPSESAPPADWVVRFKVEHIELGNYAHPTFEFRVHSPARSRLEVGERYQVEARWNGTQYVVDENQWLTLHLSYQDLTKIRRALTEYLRAWENDDSEFLLANTESASIMNLARTGSRIGLWILDPPNDADEAEFIWRRAGSAGPAFIARVERIGDGWQVSSVDHLFLHIPR